MCVSWRRCLSSNNRHAVRRSRSDLAAGEIDRVRLATARQAHAEVGALGTINHVEDPVEEHALDIHIVDGQELVIDLNRTVHGRRRSVHELSHEDITVGLSLEHHTHTNKPLMPQQVHLAKD